MCFSSESEDEEESVGARVAIMVVWLRDTRERKIEPL